MKMKVISHDYVALVGNDDVLGIHGIANIRARQLFEKYENLEGIYAALDAGTLQEEFPKNIVAALSDNRERVFEMRNSLLDDTPEVTESEVEVETTKTEEDETPDADAAPEAQEASESQTEIPESDTASVESQETTTPATDSEESTKVEPTSEQVPEADTASDDSSEDADETVAYEDQPTEEAVQTDVVPESDTDSEEVVTDAEPTEDETPDADAAPEVTEEGLRRLEPLTATLERVGEDAEFAQFILRLNRTDSHDTVVEVWGNRDSVGFIGKVLRRIGKVVERVVGHAYLFSWSGNWKRGYQCQWGRERYVFHWIIPADHEASAPFDIARGRNSEIHYHIQSSEDESE